jgi:hypothetical protein
MATDLPGATPARRAACTPQARGSASEPHGRGQAAGGRHDHQIGEGPWPMRAHQLPARAEVLLARMTELARAAALQRVGDHLIAQAQMRHTRAARHHLAGELVAHDQGGHAQAVVAQEARQLAAADADRLDPQQHLVWPRRRLSQLL